MSGFDRGEGVIAPEPSSASPSVDVSIILPTKNGAAAIDRVLAAIESQRTSLTFEILVIDSGSQDGTLEILQRHGVRLHEIRPEEFSHSRTRNLGARLSKAERFLLFLNQDAVPDGPLWLERMARPLLDNPSIKAVCALELDDEQPAPFDVAGVGCYGMRNSLFEVAYVMGPETAVHAARLPPALARQLYLFSTVCAMFDKEYFEEHPFDPRVEYGEDLHWAVATTRAGQEIAFISSARVHHHREISEREQLRRLKLELQLGVDVFGPGYRHKWARIIWALGLHRVARSLQRAVQWLVNRVGG